MIEPTEMESEAPEMESEDEVALETASTPMSLIGAEVSPGDVVRFEVVDVDGDSGWVTVKYAKPKEKEQPSKLGVESMAAEFD